MPRQRNLLRAHADPGRQRRCYGRAAARGARRSAFANCWRRARLPALQRGTQSRAHPRDRLSARAWKDVARRGGRAREEISRLRTVYDDSRRLLRPEASQTEMKARAMPATAIAESNGSRLFLLICAWGVHL